MEENKSTIVEFTPEWIAQIKKEFLKEKEFCQSNNDLFLFEKGTQFISKLERAVDIIGKNETLMVDEVEILKYYTWDPNCKTCHGRGRIGINRIQDKDKKGSFYQLQLCYCAKPGESDYLKLEKKIGEYMQHHDHRLELLTSAMLKFGQTSDELNKTLQANSSVLEKALNLIDRHTAGYWVSRFVNLFSMKEEHALTAESIIPPFTEQG